MKDLFIAVGKYGAATVIAVYLVIQLASTLPTIQAQHEMMLGSLGKNAEKIDTIIKDGEKRELRSIQMLRAICLILSSNSQEKLLCNPKEPEQISIPSAQ